MDKKRIAASAAAAAIAACAAWPAAASEGAAASLDAVWREGGAVVTVENPSLERMDSVVVKMAASEGGAFAGGARASEAAVGALAPGSSATVRFDLDVARPAVLLATVEVEGSTAAAKGIAAAPAETAAAAEEGAATLSLERAAEPSLSIEQTTDLPDGRTAAVGDVVRIVVKVRNDGTSDAAEVLVRSIVPKGTSVVDGSVTEGGGVGSGGRFVEWTVPSIAAGSWAEMSYEAAVASAEGSVSSQASCEGDAAGKAGSGTTLATVSNPVVIETGPPSAPEEAPGAAAADAPRDEAVLSGPAMPKTGDPWAGAAAAAITAAPASAGVLVAAARRIRRRNDREGGL